MTKIDDMEAVLVSLLGLGEDGDNHNLVTEWYGEDGSWCDMLISYAAFKSKNEQAVCFGKKFAYTVAHVDAFKAKGQWHNGTAGIQRGDIVFFNWHDGGDDIDHVGFVTGVKDGVVSTIEGNVHNECARRTRDASTIVGYGRPKYGAVAPTPVTAPPKKEAPAVSTTVIFEDIGPHGTVAANKVVQVALNRFRPGVVVDGLYGPQTTAAYAAWQRHLGFTGRDADGLPGWTSMTRLAAAYGFLPVHRTGKPKPAPKPTPAPAPAPKPSATPSIGSYLTVPEPAHDYRRVTFGGKTVNVRTREMLKLAATWAGVTISLTQGSYNKGVAASAGTHDGGGCVDIDVDAWSSATRGRVVQALRKAGFAAWLRTPAQGFDYHIHACAIGDREMASVAKSQVQSYFNGRNGLASNGPTEGETHWPNWADKYNR